MVPLGVTVCARFQPFFFMSFSPTTQAVCSVK